MNKVRLETFGDAVIAITIMVLEFRSPERASITAVIARVPKFFTYILSYIFLAMYWNNHHHLFQAVEKVNGAVLWENLLYFSGFLW
jgi:uncharacterized membrane protein